MHRKLQGRIMVLCMMMIMMMMMRCITIWQLYAVEFATLTEENALLRRSLAKQACRERSSSQGASGDDEIVRYNAKAWQSAQAQNSDGVTEKDVERLHGGTSPMSGQK